MKYAVFCAFLACAHAQTLHYVINWQSGLNLGEATLSSQKSSQTVNGAQTPRWNFSLDIDAGVPGFDISDQYTSSAAGDLCSAKLEKTVHHGHRRSEETVLFDQDQHTVTRQTHPTGIGGTSETSAPSCARDALAYLQFVRQELAQGRLAPQGPVILGAEYNVRLEFAGTEQIKKLGQMVEADKIHATIQGPASDLGVDIFFAKDPARTPVAARIPLSLGTFSVELSH